MLGIQIGFPRMTIFLAQNSKLTVSAQNQTNEGLFKIDIQMNYDYVALNWLLSVPKSLN